MKDGILGNLYILFFDFSKWIFILGYRKKESGTLKLRRREYKKEVQVNWPEQSVIKK